MSMSAREARAEIKKMFEEADAIESKYEGEITNNEDLAEVKRLLGEIDGLESRLADLEDAEQRKNRILAGVDRYAKPVPGQRPNPVVQEIIEGNTVTPGDQFIQDRDYKRLRSDGAFNSSVARVAFGVQLKNGTSLIMWHAKASSKALVYGTSTAVGGGLVANDVRPGVIEMRQRELMVLDLIPRLQTESDTVEYVEQTTFTNNAATVAEATNTTGTSGLKPESALAYEVKTEAVRTIATWIPVTNRMLADAPRTRGLINSDLLLMLGLEIEDQVVAGGGTGEDFTGFTVKPGVNIQGKGADNELDAIFKGRTQVRVNGKGRPNAVLIHPNDWQAIRLARENASTATLGQYLMGPPSQVGAVTTWGIPVVESEAMTENTAIVADFNLCCALYDREEAAIRVGTIDDQFVRNMQTILAELRAAFIIHRPKMVTKVTGI